MIITLVKADFSANNIGMINSWMINRALGTGAMYEGPNTVAKGEPLNATIKLSNGYYLLANEIMITMGGINAGSVFTINDSIVTINIPKVTGNIVIYVPTVSAEGDIDKIINQWVTITPAMAIGSTSDDTVGTMGNTNTNVNRYRTAEAIKCDLCRLTAPAGMMVWFNIFDEDGKLITTSGTSRAFPGEAGTMSSLTIAVKDAGGCYVWPIFKKDSAGTSPVTDEQKAAIKIEIMNLGVSTINWEQGTFSDTTGEKVDNKARVRTANKIEVPSSATGIKFIPSGTIDLWIKTYETADQLLPTMNGIKGSTYWNTQNKGIQCLTWAQICSNGKRPAYVDYVLKADATSLSPDEVVNVVIEFTA